MQKLEPYRKRIDALDDAIIDLLAQRFALVREVGAIKAQDHIPAVLPERIDEVLARCIRRAEDKGIDPEIIKALYTLLIDHSCALEDRIKQIRSKHMSSDG